MGGTEGDHKVGQQQPTISEVLLNDMLILLPVTPPNDEIVVRADGPEILLKPAWPDQHQQHCLMTQHEPRPHKTSVSSTAS